MLHLFVSKKILSVCKSDKVIDSEQQLEKVEDSPEANVHVDFA